MEQRVYALDDPFFHAGNALLEDFAAKDLAAKHYDVDEQQAANRIKTSEELFYTDESLEDLKCHSCGARLMNDHLLDLHFTEAHDPFFAAQAARRLKVFRCLVEGCDKLFSSVMDRKKHLADYHLWPSNYAFDRLHLGKKQAQQRPDASFRRAEPGRAKRVGQQKQSRSPSEEAQDKLVSARFSSDATEVDQSIAKQEASIPFPQNFDRLRGDRQNESIVDADMQDDGTARRLLGMPDTPDDQTVVESGDGNCRHDEASQRKPAKLTSQGESLGVADTDMKDVEGLSKGFAGLRTGQPKATGVRASRLQL